MRQAQVVVYEPDEKLARELRETCHAHGWRLRELRRSRSVTNVLREGANVLVIRVGRDLFDEMALLERLTWSFPETAVVIAGESVHPELVALAWDLGASYVQLPLDSGEDLQSVVRSLMETND